ncbi:hypothetical protein FTUN_7631 [Frigoriglobus tundricola]|uniref:Uncharacterized protein n=1 Tax=Frigoriglobus tundricola TaxID=2774151 RepID=A0A6M5Z1G5_9BACT|nr:hypothetical protein FTUN_7631 [Frigoriglobus tundricola]
MTATVQTFWTYGLSVSPVALPSLAGVLGLIGCAARAHRRWREAWERYAAREEANGFPPASVAQGLVDGSISTQTAGS